MSPMNKMYLAIVGFLLVIALLVGGYAFYKTANQAPAIYTPPPAPTIPPVQPENKPSTPAASPVTNVNANAIPLSISSFKDSDIISAARLTVKGKTAPNADVSINDADTKADATGSFSSFLTLEEGDNAIEIVASDPDGNYSVWNATVTYTPTQ